MIHRYSIAVDKPKHVAAVLAELFEGTITPFGPYAGSYTVWTGDEHGTAVELFPAGTETMPDEGAG